VKQRLLRRSSMSSRAFTRVILLMLFIPLLSGCEFDATPMDIRSLDKRTESNDALACAAGLCAVAADFESPAFAVSVEEFLTIAETVVVAEDRTKIVAKDKKLQQLVFVQRSRILRFPDTIWIQGVKTDTGTALIIYSRSNYGESDFGVNKRRVGEWLAKLTERIETRRTGG
jgi:uncharacterized protein (DUF1499 family)